MEPTVFHNPSETTMNRRQREKMERRERMRKMHGTIPDDSVLGTQLIAALSAQALPDTACEVSTNLWQPAEEESIELEGAPELESETVVQTTVAEQAPTLEPVAMPEPVVEQVPEPVVEQVLAPVFEPDPPFAIYAMQVDEPSEPILHTRGPDPDVGFDKEMEKFVDAMTGRQTDTLAAVAPVDPDILAMVRIALDPNPMMAIAIRDVQCAENLTASNTVDLVSHALKANATIIKARADLVVATTRETEALHTSQAKLRIIEQLNAEINDRTEELIKERRMRRDAETFAANISTRTSAKPSTKEAERTLSERVRSVATELSQTALDIPLRYRELYDRFMKAKATFYDARARRGAIVKRAIDEETLPVELDLTKSQIAHRRGLAPVETISRYERLIARTQELQRQFERVVEECSTAINSILTIQGEYRELSEQAEKVRAKLADVPKLCEVFDISIEPEIRSLLADTQSRLMASDHTRSVTTFMEQTPAVPPVLAKLFDDIPKHRAFLLTVRGFKIEQLFTDKVSRKDAIGRMILIAYRLLVNDVRGRSHKSVIAILQAGEFINADEVDAAQKAAATVKSMFNVERYQIYWVWKPTEASNQAGDSMLASCKDPIAVEELLRRAQDTMYAARRATANTRSESDEDED